MQEATWATGEHLRTERVAFQLSLWFLLALVAYLNGCVVLRSNGLRIAR